MSLRQLRQKVWLVAFFIVTFSYNRGLQYCTLEPIAKILESEKNSICLGPLLHDFKKRKEQEIYFVQRAVSEGHNRRLVALIGIIRPHCQQQQ